MLKLVGKIGPALSANLVGDALWDYSLLEVSKEGGVREVWKTRQIWNVSKLGKDYPQWPTRLLK